MSVNHLKIKLEQLEAKIKEAELEKDNFIRFYYASLIDKLKDANAHGLPPEVLIGALVDAIHKYQLNDPIIQKWEGMARPFFRPKRAKKTETATQGRSKVAKASERSASETI
jgi:hypothetical protein